MTENSEKCWSRSHRQIGNYFFLSNQHLKTQIDYFYPNSHLSGCFYHFHAVQNPTRWVCLGAVGPDHPPCPWYSGPRLHADPLRLPHPHWSCWCHWRSPSVRHAGLAMRKRTLMLIKKQHKDGNEPDTKHLVGFDLGQRLQAAEKHEKMLWIWSCVT